MGEQTITLQTRKRKIGEIFSWDGDLLFDREYIQQAVIQEAQEKEREAAEAAARKEGWRNPQSCSDLYREPTPFIGYREPNQQQSQSGVEYTNIWEDALKTRQTSQQNREEEDKEEEAFWMQHFGYGTNHYNNPEYYEDNSDGRTWHEGPEEAYNPPAVNPESSYYYDSSSSSFQITDSEEGGGGGEELTDSDHEPAPEKKRGRGGLYKRVKLPSGINMYMPLSLTKRIKQAQSDIEEGEAPVHISSSFRQSNESDDSDEEVLEQLERSLRIKRFIRKKNK